MHFDKGDGNRRQGIPQGHAGVGISGRVDDDEFDLFGSSGLNPGDLASELDVAPATLSFHLKELTNAGLITQERQGRYLVYRASFESMNELLAYLTENCCQGEACGISETVACK